MTTRHRVEISSDGEHGVGTRVNVGGLDIAHLVTSLHLDVDVSEPTQLILSLRYFPYSTVLDDVPVRVDDETRDFLIRNGWTPPPEEAPNELD